MNEQLSNSPEVAPIVSDVYAELYFYAAFTYRHPEREAEDMAKYMEYCGASVEAIRAPSPMDARELTKKMSSHVKTMVKEAGKELGISWENDAIDDATATSLHDYLTQQWEAGKNLASDLTEEEPELDDLKNPLQSVEDVQHEWQRMHPAKRQAYRLSKAKLGLDKWLQKEK